MIPTLSRYSPNSPQTPARQTAPAAQRQGYRLKVFYNFGKDVEKLRKSIYVNEYTLQQEIKGFQTKIQKKRDQYVMLIHHFWGMYLSKESLIEFLNTQNEDVDPVLQQAIKALKELNPEQLQSKSILPLIINDLLALRNGLNILSRRITQAHRTASSIEAPPA